MAIRVLSCDNFDVTDLAAHTIDAKVYAWTARVSADVMIHIKRMEFDDARTGTIAFSAVASNGDRIALVSRDDDVEFVFGDGTGGTVDKGISATASAQNLKAAINAYTLSAGLDLVISGGAATLTLTTNDPFIFIEEVVDSGAVITVTGIDYDNPATSDDSPFTEFDDLLFGVAEGEALSFICGEPLTGFVSVAEIKKSS